MSEASLRPNRTLKVMVVEDEPRLRELLLRAIGGWEYTAAAARSGEEAHRLMKAAPVDIVVLDLNLPGMDGIECLSKMREEYPSLAAIILTGFGDLESAKAAIHLDVIDFLTKPCHLGDLERSLERARRRITQQAGLPESPGDFGEEPAQNSATTLDEVERQHILAALRRHGGNRTAAAEELGISLRTLYYRLSEYQKQGFEIE